METLVIGAGPAGLTAAHELSLAGARPTIVEADTVVGGISRTANYNGYRFDIGGHRFFSKVPSINQLWQDMLREEFLVRKRQSRIHYGGRFFDYPLKVGNALSGLGIVESGRVALSYLRSRVAPTVPETTFEQWVSNRFGWRLYEVFFKTYTEKVWGMPCSEISAEWAMQRIKNLSLLEVLRNALHAKGRCRNGHVITSLIDQFHYPRLGPGMMWDRFRSSLQDRGVETLLGRAVEKIWHENGRVQGVGIRNGAAELTRHSSDQYVSSMPLRRLIESLDPPAPKAVVQAASGLRYRDFITVVLIVDRAEVFDDNWVYIHTPDVAVGRIQNYRNWSPEMVPDPSKTSLGLEYFVNMDEDMWSWPDSKLVELGVRECSKLGLIEAGEVSDGTVVRMPKAYPIYDSCRQDHVATIQRYLEGLENLHTIGRNGQHRYNNMDHSMLTGILAARNILGERHDVWAVNVEAEYHETVTSAGPSRGCTAHARKRDYPRPTSYIPQTLSDLS